MVKRIVADHISGQTGGPGQTIGIGLFAGFAAVTQGRAVRHLQHIRHVAGSGGIQDGDIHAVVQGIQHPGDQLAGIEHYGFSGLQIDLHAVRFPQTAYQGDQAIHLVVRPGDVVPASQV